MDIKKIAKPNNEDEDYSDLNDYIMKEIENLKPEESLSKSESITCLKLESESEQTSQINNSSFFKEFRNKLTVDDKFGFYQHGKYSTATNVETINYGSEDNFLSNINSNYDTNNLNTPDSTADRKSPASRICSAQVSTNQIVSQRKSPNCGSDKLKRKKRNPSKSSELYIQSISEDVKVKLLEKELVNSGYCILLDHLEMFKGSLKLLTCTQGGSRCLQTAFSNTETAILDKFAFDEVRNIYNLSYHNLDFAYNKRAFN